MEIVRSEKAGQRFVYRLAPWDDAQTLRTPVELNAAAAEQITEAYREKLKAERAADRAGWLTIPIGLLPAEEQRRLELTHGINPAIGTFVTGAVLAVWSVSSLLLVFAMMRGLDMGSLKPYAEFCAMIFPLFPFLFLESMLRAGSGLNGEPLGSFLVVVPYVLLQTLSGKRPVAAQGSERALPPAPRAPSGSERVWLQAMDRVAELPPTADGRARLEIRSRLPKEHWSANVHGIYVTGPGRDKVYILEERGELKADVQNPETHRFVLEEAPQDALFQSMHQYEPTEVREVYKARRRLIVGSRLQAFGPFWGFLEPALQEGLAQIYDFNMWRHTKQSIFFQGFGSLCLLYTSIRRMAEGTAFGADFILFLAGIVFLWEGVLRFSKLNQGEITGSILGKGIGALARPALRWRAGQSWPYPDR